MELRHLHYFIAVAEELNFRKAAERLYISQPPLSRQIKDLEHELGADLFFRNNKRVELTESGRFFLDEARAIIGRIESAKLVIRQLDDIKSGLLRIGYISSLPYHLLSAVIDAIKLKYPHVKTKLYELPTVKQVTALENFKLDVGIIRAPVKSEKLAASLLYSEQLIFAYPSEWANKFDLNDGILAFRDAPFIFFNREYAPEFRSIVVEICNRNGFDPDIAHESNSVHSIVSLIDQGMGVAILPVSMEQNCLQNGVSFIPITQPVLQTEILAVYQNQIPNALVNDFVALLEEYSRY